MGVVQDFQVLLAMIVPTSEPDDDGCGARRRWSHDKMVPDRLIESQKLHLTDQDYCLRASGYIHETAIQFYHSDPTPQMTLSLAPLVAEGRIQLKVNNTTIRSASGR
jgi:hypothetical protein